jgi:CMP-2-keto-3-deoxyoctulosonic acid synthetase
MHDSKFHAKFVRSNPTDDERVAEAVRSFGGEALMTDLDHASGTDRWQR